MQADSPSSGKLSPSVFNEFIFPKLGRKRDNILVGPQSGVDVGVVDIGNGKVLISTTDPLFFYPPLGWEKAAWLAIHIIASDAATSGVAPPYMSIDLNLPQSLSDEDFSIIWNNIHSVCDNLGISIISGHTGRYDGCEFPMIGTATMLTVGEADEYVTPKMATPGDVVILTKGAAIETAGMFAATYPELLAERYGDEFATEAENLFYEITVVKDALTAASVGVRQNGVTSMHDATECGVYGALYEIGTASGNGLIVHKGDILVPETVKKICLMFDIDPYCASSEGSLVITVHPDKANEVIQKLAHQSIAASVIGEVVDKELGLKLYDGDQVSDLTYPESDPFWPAFIGAGKS